MKQKLNNLKNEALAMITNASSNEELEQLRIQFLGKNGKLNEFFRTQPIEEKKDLGSLFNEIKDNLSNALNDKMINDGNKSNNFDLSLPGTPIPIGHLHPTTLVINEMNDIFKSLGFAVADGPELETEEFNYNRLNLPLNHPARDLQDTLYIEEPEYLLRTHTSSVEARILATQKPPYRYVIPGKVYRNEKANPSNNMMFYQYQGLAIGEGINLSHLKFTLNYFISQFYGKNRQSRFRCKYYPEVEPGVGVDIDCPFCHLKGCVVCKYRGFIEILGAGMVHPNMLKKVGLDPNKISGFAWGMGLDRIVMDRTGISDIRSLYNGDITYQL